MESQRRVFQYNKVGVGQVGDMISTEQYYQGGGETCAPLLITDD